MVCVRSCGLLKLAPKGAAPGPEIGFFITVNFRPGPLNFRPGPFENANFWPASCAARAGVCSVLSLPRSWHKLTFLVDVPLNNHQSFYPQLTSLPSNLWSGSLGYHPETLCFNITVGKFQSLFETRKCFWWFGPSKIFKVCNGHNEMTILKTCLVHLQLDFSYKI